MKIKSAGILLYRLTDKPEVFLVHPGGPYFAKKDKEVWSIPKGEYDEGEDPYMAALREFKEETSAATDQFTDPVPLTPVKQKGGKWVYAFAVKGDIDPSAIISNEFSVEWPPRSGKFRSFPEVDRAGWFDVQAASEKINPAQLALINELISVLKNKGELPGP